MTTIFSSMQLDKSAIPTFAMSNVNGRPFKRGRRKSMSTRSPSPQLQAMQAPGIVFQIPSAFDRKESAKNEQIPYTIKEENRQRRYGGNYTHYDFDSKRVLDSSPIQAFKRRNSTFEEDDDTLDEVSNASSISDVSFGRILEKSGHESRFAHDHGKELHRKARRASNGTNYYQRRASTAISDLPGHLISSGLESSANYDVDGADDSNLLPALSQLRAQMPSRRNRGVNVSTSDSVMSSTDPSPLLSSYHYNFAPFAHAHRNITTPLNYGSGRARRNSASYDGDYVPENNGNQYTRSAIPFSSSHGSPPKSRKPRTFALPPSPIPSPMAKAATPRKRAISLQHDRMNGDEPSAGPQRSCHSCNSTKSAQQTWRTGWNESVTLCNQCGLRYNRNGRIHCHSCNYIPTKSELSSHDNACKQCRTLL